MIIFNHEAHNYIFKGTIFVLIIGAVFGAMIIPSFKIALPSLAFIFKRDGTLLQIIYNFIVCAKYPIPIFPAATRFILMFPLGLFISLPVDTLLYESCNPYLLGLIIDSVSISFFALETLIWTLYENG